MDIKKLLGGLMVLGIFFSPACTTDDSGPGSDSPEDPVANRWIYNQMQSLYLWNDELPSNPHYNWDYDDFFKDILSDKDGKHNEYVDYYYSYITKYVANPKTGTRATVDYYKSTYGFDYILSQLYVYDPLISETNASLKLYATIAWVASGSPADSAKLKRGDHIYRIAGKEIPHDGYSSMLRQLSPSISGTSTVTFSVCTLEPTDFADAERTITEETEGGGTESIPVSIPIVTRSEKNSKTVTLTSKRMDESPILYSSTIDTTGRRIGYLVYNEFEVGAIEEFDNGNLNMETAVYNNELREKFRNFRSDNITDLVLDLRYNPGGYVWACQLLATLIAPSSYEGKVFQLNEFNDGSIREENYFKGESSNNVGLERVYILATGSSASASEALIHCLRGSGIEVYHIGSTTEGKNVGMSLVSTAHTITEGSEQHKKLNSYRFDAWPVTFYIKDANGDMYPSYGLKPGYRLYEEFEIDLIPLGDKSEPMLAAAMHHILTGSYPPATRAQSGAGTPISVDRQPVPMRRIKPVKPYKAIEF